MLGVLLDRAHEMPPELLAPLVAEEVTRIGGDVSVPLQDDEQLTLMPLRGRRLFVEEPQPVSGSPGTGSRWAPPTGPTVSPARPCPPPGSGGAGGRR